MGEFASRLQAVLKAAEGGDEEEPSVVAARLSADLRKNDVASYIEHYSQPLPQLMNTIQGWVASQTAILLPSFNASVQQLPMPLAPTTHSASRITIILNARWALITNIFPRKFSRVIWYQWVERRREFCLQIAKFPVSTGPYIQGFQIPGQRPIDDNHTWEDHTWFSPEQWPTVDDVKKIIKRDISDSMKLLHAEATKSRPG